MHAATHEEQKVKKSKGKNNKRKQRMTPVPFASAAVEGKREDPRFPGNGPRYAHIDPDELPLTESLQLIQCYVDHHISGQLLCCD